MKCVISHTCDYVKNTFTQYLLGLYGRKKKHNNVKLYGSKFSNKYKLCGKETKYRAALANNVKTNILYLKWTKKECRHYLFV